MRHSGIRQQDRLIGVDDGASWVAGLFDTLGVEQRVLDVYHATLYLERVLLALNWSDAEREAERRLERPTSPSSLLATHNAMRW